MKSLFFKNIFYACFFLLGMTAFIPHAFGASVFPVSTEFQIGKIKPMVERAPPGVYISVGSERIFRGASMTPNITKVYLLDLAPEILRFNQINIELLKAPSREEYLKLRWEASYETWQELKANLKQADFDWWQKNVRDLEGMDYSLPESLNKYQSNPDAKRFLTMRDKLVSFYQAWKAKETPTLPQNLFVEAINLEEIKALENKLQIPFTVSDTEWKWWTSIGRNKELHCSKVWLENPEEVVDLGQVVDFKTGNYLFDDMLYKRLHDLAINNKFVIQKIDLSNNTEFEKFLAMIKKDKQPIAVLDLDNLYFKDYIGEKKYKEIVEKFVPLGQDTSLLIVMSNFKDYACGQFQVYIGFTFENIRHWPPHFLMQSFFDTLPKNMGDLLNGRVYEKEETPPLHFLLGN